MYFQRSFTNTARDHEGPHFTGRMIPKRSRYNRTPARSTLILPGLCVLFRSYPRSLEVRKSRRHYTDSKSEQARLVRTHSSEYVLRLFWQAGFGFTPQPKESEDVLRTTMSESWCPHLFCSDLDAACF